METEREVDRLRRIMKWIDWQDEFYFDELTMPEIFLLHWEVTEHQGIDLIEDMKNPTFDEWLSKYKAMRLSYKKGG